jgi:photosystem II stability/assembly factor-like uncharacterized protein
VYYSADGGQNWSPGKNTSFCRFGLNIVDQQTAWNCGNGGHVRVSTDGGKNWQAVANFGGSEPDQCCFLSFLDAHTGWAAAPQLLGVTTNGGSIWNKLALPKGIKDVAAIALRTATEGYLLDTTGTVFVTTDGGLTWKREPVAITYNAPTLYLAHDGLILTAID